MALVAKNLPANAGDVRDMDLIPGSGRSPGEGKGYPLQYSCLLNPKDRGAWRAIVHRVAKSWTWLKQLSTEHRTAHQFLSEKGLDKTPNWLIPFTFGHIFFIYALSIYTLKLWWFSTNLFMSVQFSSYKNFSQFCSVWVTAPWIILFQIHKCPLTLPYDPEVVQIEC